MPAIRDFTKAVVLLGGSRELANDLLPSALAAHLRMGAVFPEYRSRTASFGLDAALLRLEPQAAHLLARFGEPLWRRRNEGFPGVHSGTPPASINGSTSEGSL
jgi:hypothetical protein